MAQRFSVLALAGALLWAAGCGSAEVVDPSTDEGEQTDLTTGQVVMNYVGAPFRLVGAAVVYPLKFLFYDAPLWVYDQFHDPDPFDEALDQLASPNARLRQEAVEALGASGREEAVDPLRRLLWREADPGVRVECVFALKRLGDRRAFADIAPLLSDRDARVRRMAVLAAGTLGPPGVIADLYAAWERLAEYDPERLWYQTALINLGDRRMVALCQALAEDEEAPALFRSTALWGIGVLAPEGAEEQAARHMTDEDERLRVAAASALARLGKQARLRAFAEGDHEGAAEAALKHVGLYGGETDLPWLRALRDRAQGERRFWTVWALAERDDEQAVPELFAYLEADVFYLNRTYAAEQLWRLTGQEFKADRAAWERWWHAEGAETYAAHRRARRERAADEPEA